MSSPTTAHRVAAILAKEFEAKVKNASVNAQCDALSMMLKAVTALDVVEPPPTLLPTMIPSPSQEITMSAFCAECIVKELGAEIKLYDLLTVYKKWFKFNRDRKTLTRSQLIHKMTDIYGKPVDTEGRVWGGVRFREDDE